MADDAQDLEKLYKLFFLNTHQEVMMAMWREDVRLSVLMWP